MTPLHDEALTRLDETAAAFVNEAHRLAAQDEAGSATVSNEVVSVTVNGAGLLTRVEFSAEPVSPHRWVQLFGDAYSQALAERIPASTSAEVPGPPGQPPSAAPRAPEQAEFEAEIQAMGPPTITGSSRGQFGELVITAESGGLTLSVNALPVIVAAEITPAALQTPQLLDALVMSVYREALRGLGYEPTTGALS